MRETITHTQRLYDGRVIALDVHDITLPDGAPAVRERVVHPGAVAIVPLDAAGNVLMVRQFRLAADRVMLEIPAGTLKVGEDPLVCAERELQEETGYRPGKLEPLGGVFVAPGYTTEYIHLYLATDLTESRLPGDEDEFIELERVPLAQAVAWTLDGTLIDAKSVTALLKTARRLGV
ncbi:MAG: NUDIX hydrolase [Anaerolineae bacterium]|jgi:ADP-ribose pyrophosphatase|nr:NUDIX hydrolase [Anaerolineae bacterium]